MIATILIFPLISIILMAIFKNKKFDNLMLNACGIVHFICTLFLVFTNNCANTSYFGVDDTSKIFLLILSFVFMLVVFYNNGYVKNFKLPQEQIRNYCFMTIIFVLSMTGTLLSTNLGISWILIEATTLSSAYLIYFNKTKNAIEAAWKYVFICSIGIALAFVGIILLNISTESINSLNFNVLYTHAATFNPFWLKLAFTFMLFGFGAKMGLAPIHFWLPDAHSESPSPISALLSATLLNSAFLVIIRVFKIMEIAHVADYARLLLLIMGFVSIFVTAVFIYHIKNYKRMLAYSSIENMGILAIGTALGGSAILAVVLHLIGHSLAKASFFLTSGNVLELFETKRIKSIKGLSIADGKTAWLWILSFLAICAFPTSLLFVSEFVIIKNMIMNEQYILCVIFVLLLTIIIYGMGKVVMKMAYGELSEDKKELIELNKEKLSAWMYIPQIILILLVFILGVYIPPFLSEIINKAVIGF